MKKTLISTLAALMALVLAFSAFAASGTVTYDSPHAGCALTLPAGCIPLTEDTLQSILRSDSFDQAIDDIGISKDLFYQLLGVSDIEMVLSPTLSGNLIIGSEPFGYTVDVMEVLYTALDASYKEYFTSINIPIDNVDFRGMIDVFGSRAYSLHIESLGAAQDVYVFFDGKSMITFTFTDFSNDDIMTILKSFVENH